MTYEVGYKKPPKHGRFKKGQSGNPRGRPRRPKHEEPEANGERMKALVSEEAYRLIDIHEGGKTIRLPLIQVMIGGWVYWLHKEIHAQCATIWTCCA